MTAEIIHLKPYHGWKVYKYKSLSSGKWIYVAKKKDRTTLQYLAWGGLRSAMIDSDKYHLAQKRRAAKIKRQVARNYR